MSSPSVLKYTVRELYDLQKYDFSQFNDIRAHYIDTKNGPFRFEFMFHNKINKKSKINIKRIDDNPQPLRNGELFSVTYTIENPENPTQVNELRYPTASFTEITFEQATQPPPLGGRKRRNSRRRKSQRSRKSRKY